LAYDDVNTAYPIVDTVEYDGSQVDANSGYDYHNYSDAPSKDYYFGYKKFNIQLTDQKGIDADTKIASIECRFDSQYGERATNPGISHQYTSFPAGALVTSVDNGVATIEFKSDFYDNALVILTDNNGLKHYFEITRSGIIITGARTGGDSKNAIPLRHGHIDVTDDNDASISMMKADGSAYEYGIYATYYYPDKNQSSADVDLYVTITYQDGRIESALLTSDIFTKAYTDEYETNFTASSDYFIYMDTAQEGIAPAKVEAIAVPKSDSNGKIKGAKFGSNHGVVKTIEIDY